MAPREGSVPAPHWVAVLSGPLTSLHCWSFSVSVSGLHDTSACHFCIPAINGHGSSARALCIPVISLHGSSARQSAFQPSASTALLLVILHSGHPWPRLCRTSGHSALQTRTSTAQPPGHSASRLSMTTADLAGFSDSSRAAEPVLPPRSHPLGTLAQLALELLALNTLRHTLALDCWLGMALAGQLPPAPGRPQQVCLIDMAWPGNCLWPRLAPRPHVCLAAPWTGTAGWDCVGVGL